MKVALSNSGTTTATCSCKVASTRAYYVDGNYREPSIDFETTIKSNKNLEKAKNQQNKNISEKLDSDNINEKNKKQEYHSENNNKKEKKKDEENKKHEYGKKTKNSENDLPTEKTESCIYFGRQYGQKTKWVFLHEKS